MERFGRNLRTVDTEEGKQKIIRAMVEHFNAGYLNEWQPVHPKKYQGYEVHQSGMIRCWWRYDGGGKRRRKIPVTVTPYLPVGKRYLYVTLKDRRGNYANKAVHLLVANVFLGKQPVIQWTVFHWNGIPSDNRASNLWWFPRGIYERRKAINYWKRCRKGEIV